MPHAFKLAHRLSRYRSTSLWLILSLAACSSSDSPTAPSTRQDFARNRRTVIVTPAIDTVQVGRSVQLTATVMGGYGQTMTGAMVTWTSSDSTVASINESGLAKAMRPGSATVTATSAGYTGRSGITVTAVPAPGAVTDLTVSATNSSSVTLVFTEVSDGSGAPASYDVRYAAGTVIWGPAPSVASGTCTTPVAGTAVGHKRSCTVTGLTAATRYQFQLVAFRGILNVNAVFGALSNIASGTTALGAGGAASITISPVTAAVTVGGSQLFTATVKDAVGNVLAGQGVTFGSSNAAVASVGSGSGIATGLASGTATITASDGTLAASATLAVATPTSGSPSPGVEDTVLFDTRAGGRQSIQSVSTLASALATTGMDVNAKSTGGFTVYPVAFTTNVDGKGTHAFVMPWQQNAGDVACHGNTTSEDDLMIEKGISSQGGPYVDGEIFLSYKVWYGRTATGGGVGGIGSYSEGSGHKFLVWTRRPFGGGANINDGRLTLEENTHGGQLVVANYAGYTGPPVHPDNNEIAEEFFWGTGNAATCTWCTSGSQWLPSNTYNQANALTFRFRPESVLNAADGQMEMWANGALVFDSTGQYTYNGGWASLQIGGPTWICPPQDQTEYVWDIVVWQHRP